ncbi:hypothetical protein NKG05_17460 [Oerskovia sp. M15]
MAPAYGRAPTPHGRTYPLPVCGFCKHLRARSRSIRDLKTDCAAPGAAGSRCVGRSERGRDPGYAQAHGNHLGVRDHPLIIHNTKAVLDQWGSDGWELVQVVTGPDGNGLVAYLKRPTGGQ